MSQEEKPNEEQQRCSRRDAFIKIGVGSTAVAGLGAAIFGYEYMSPNVLYEASPVVNVGKVDRFPVGSLSADPQTGIYVVHAPEGLYAMSLVCTHLGCLTTWKPELGIIACPCHGSKFNRDGSKLEGPAPRPLEWLKVSISDEGDLLVDRSAVIPQKQYVRV